VLPGEVHTYLHLSPVVSGVGFGKEVYVSYDFDGSRPGGEKGLEAAGVVYVAVAEDEDLRLVWTYAEGLHVVEEDRPGEPRVVENSIVVDVGGEAPLAQKSHAERRRLRKVVVH